MSSPKPSVTLRILPKNLKPGVVILFQGGVKETTTSVNWCDDTMDYLVKTDLHPDGIRCPKTLTITIEG